MMNKAKKIISKLNNEGFEAYIVGGAVRDSLLGLNPSDIDIASNATPEEVMELFSKAYPSGIKFGTVTVIEDESEFEVTTFRSDGKYVDGRRPEEVVYSQNIKEDLSRRDFTINAMAMNTNGEIIDLFGGKKDLQKGMIKCVGNPHKRFKEDALRILRAFRFIARFDDFKVEEETLKAIKSNKENLKNVSCERVREEISKILMTNNVRKTFNLMQEVGVLEIILPEISAMHGVEQNNPHHVYDVFNHTMVAVENAPNNEILRWVMLLHDVGKVATKSTDKEGVDHFYKHNIESMKVAKSLLSRLNFSNKDKKEILELIEFHDRQIQPSPRAIRRLLNKLQHTSLENLLIIKKADAKAQSLRYLEPKLANLSKIKSLANTEKKLTVKDLDINGYDLMSIGLQGKDIGIMQRKLLNLVLDNPSINNKKALMKYARENN